MMFHHSIAGYLQVEVSEPALTRCFAGHAPPDRSQAVYIIVNPVTMTNNGETQAGQVSPKKGMMLVDIFGCAQHTLTDLVPYVEKVKRLLSGRNFAITGFHVYGLLLQSEMPMDFVSDPQGAETGVCCVKLYYSCNYGART
jgi:hypothetical protein